MKTGLIKSIILSVVFFCFTNCENTSYIEGNGHILVTVQGKGHSTVYLKAGTLEDPNIPLDDYDYSLPIDALRQAHFTNLSPNDYFIYAKNISGSLTGIGSVQIVNRYRHNTYSVTVNLK